MTDKYIVKRLRHFAWAMVVFGCLLFLVLCLQMTGHVRPWMLAPLAALFVLLLYSGYARIITPLRKNNHIKALFARGDSYEDIYHLEFPLSPEEEAMIQRFSLLMDKNELIGASQKKSEYLALQNQINPHFLYNTLEGIRAEAVIAGVDTIAEMTEALATYFRYTISNMSDLVTLEEELANVENYYYIQQFRFGDRLKLRITYDCQEEEEALHCRLPKLTLQPIVENSIYHGLEQKVGDGHLGIRITMTDQHLLILVSDDGIGMEEEQVERLNGTLRALRLEEDGQESPRGGIAVRNVNNRIKLLFGECYGIYLYSEPGAGTDVEITLPVVQS